MVAVVLRDAVDEAVAVSGPGETLGCQAARAHVITYLTLVLGLQSGHQHRNSPNDEDPLMPR